MGSGYWNESSFKSYSTRMNRSVASDGSLSGHYDVQDMFVAKRIDPMLDPKNVMRECCDSEEHPNSIPVILGLDVTGSMGPAGVEVAKKLNPIITSLYKKYDDIEICVMGIGDLYCDKAPIQISQFESDIRIAEQLDKIYFEKGGGGNSYESYTAAWYMGVRHMKLDCWKRGSKGIIITTGDEPLNPYLPRRGRYCGLEEATGDSLQDDINTRDLYEQASKKFDIYHIAVKDRSTCYESYRDDIENTFGQVLPQGHLKTATLNELSEKIVDCIDDSLAKDNNKKVNVKQVESKNSNGEITW